MGLELVRERGGEVWVAEAPDWTGATKEVLRIGISQTAVRVRAERGLRFMIGQLYGVLGPGLLLAEHVFQGLKRDMLVRGDSHADVNKLAITWAAPRDAYFAGDGAERVATVVGKADALEHAKRFLIRQPQNLSDAQAPCCWR